MLACLRKTRIHTLAIAALLATTAGCSHYGAARITSIPDGAEVINLEDDTILGVTPTEVLWRKPSGDNQYMSLRLRKEGYYDKVVSFWLSMRHGSEGKALKNLQAVEVNMLPKKQ